MPITEGSFFRRVMRGDTYPGETLVQEQGVRAGVSTTELTGPNKTAHHNMLRNRHPANASTSSSSSQQQLEQRS